MGNYKGSFKGRDYSTDSPGEIYYSVFLIGNTASSSYTEVAMAGRSPFTSRLESVENPFSPVYRTTATISVVHNDYLADILSPYAKGTQVRLVSNDAHFPENPDDGYIRWIGYLTPRVYSQGYDDCLETIELEATDLFGVLQYFDYETEVPKKKKIVSIYSILERMTYVMGVPNLGDAISEMYFGATKYDEWGNRINPERIMISEKNFFSNDTDEPWKWSEVLDEIMRYLGMNAMWRGNILYFFDYSAINVNDPTFDVFMYECSGTTWYPAVSDGQPRNVSWWLNTVDEDSFAQSGAQISFEPVYNKISVKDNFYFVEEFVPNVLDDKYLTNIINPCEPSTYYTVSAETPYVADTEDSQHPDSAYTYYQKYWNHKYWKSVYRESSGATPVTLTRAQRSSVNPMRNYLGATIVDTSAMKDGETDMIQSGWTYGDYSLPSKNQYDRYLCISEKGGGTKQWPWNTWIESGSADTVMQLTGYSSQFVSSEKSYVVINFSAMFEKHINRAYINPDWNSDRPPRPSGSYVYAYMWALFPFVLQIGDKYWDGYTATWTTTPKYFVVRYNLAKNLGDLDDDSVPKPQTNYQILNNISWEEEIDAQGYIIPLSGVDMTGEITIKIQNPSAQWMIQKNGVWNYDWNAYCWIKDLTFKVVESKQDADGEEQDVIYENSIDGDAVSQMSDIDMKITTWAEHAKPSYSNMIIQTTGGTTTLLSGIREKSKTQILTPEENVVEKYINQYSTPTKKITATLKINRDFNRYIQNYKGLDVEDPECWYHCIGEDIDYESGSVNITIIQDKN